MVDGSIIVAARNPCYHRRVRQFSLVLRRLVALPDGRLAAEVGQEAVLDSSPGRFYLALAADMRGAYLRQPVHPAADEAGSALEVPAAWAHLQPGEALDLLGPCGRACELPERAHNVLLVAGAHGASRLLPLARAALARRAAVTLVSAGTHTLRGLPAEIEVRFGAAGLGEALEWADAIYADLPAADLPALQARLRAAAGTSGPEARAYRLPPAPCGVGACGACAVATRSGWRLACLDGPWFPLLELEL
jgi:dihydroorotate dehydrogenase electron transfer subunit